MHKVPQGCSAVVLDHHRDDILETFFTNLLHGGRLATMPPKLVNEEGDLFVYWPRSIVKIYHRAAISD